jgi:FMN-dependent NADH-azoreductase
MHILQVLSSPRGAASSSTQLSNGIVERLLTANPGSTVTVHDLSKTPFPHLEEAHLQSFFTPAESHTPAQQEAARHSDAAIAELLAADVIVIAGPVYNFGVPSTLKTWIDHLARAGQTFRFTAAGPEGLVIGKKVYLAVASGGIFSAGRWMASDFMVPQLKAALGFLGITDIKVVRVEGTNMPEVQDTALTKGLASIEL